MEQKRLGDVATYINGYAFKPEDRGSEGLPIIRIQDLTGNAYDVGFYNGNYPERIEIKNGDVLISWSASLGVYIWNRGRALLNQHIFKVVFDKAEVNKQYFVYVVKYNLKEMETKAHGATMKHIIKKDFDNTRIPFPSLEEQAKIANILSKVANIIETRKQELQKLDDLIKARFVEMFGNPDINEKKWNEYKMEQLCEVGSSKRIYQNDQSLTGIPFLRISDLVNRMDTGSKDCDLFIPEELFGKLKKQGLVPVRGDILLTARGTLGRCYIIQDEDEFYFQDGMITWLSKYDERITPLYISYLFEMPGFRKQIDSLQAGSTVAYLSISMIKKLNVMTPPIELQEQFSDFVKQVDKSKVAILKNYLQGVVLSYDN